VKFVLVGLVVVVTVVALICLVEVILVKASEYRLSHGDGRERAFRR
jgi:hypothetical protein